MLAFPPLTTCCCPRPRELQWECQAAGGLPGGGTHARVVGSYRFPLLPFTCSLQVQGLLLLLRRDRTAAAHNDNTVWHPRREWCEWWRRMSRPAGTSTHHLPAPWTWHTLAHARPTPCLQHLSSGFRSQRNCSTHNSVPNTHPHFTLLPLRL